MIWLLTFVGAAGAGSLFAVDTSPALGARTKNTAGILVAVLIGLALWHGGIPAAWALPGAWCASFLLMGASAFQVGANDMIWMRVATSTVLVVMAGQFFQ
jgi:hypothetical protein